MKKVTVPMKFEMTKEVLNDNFHKVKLYVCHNGVNYNGSKFSDMAIANASKTLQNIPILAYINRDEEGNATGFGGHEVEYKLEEKDGEFYFTEHYLEVPIGVIPSQNEYSIESIDGRNYVVCTGYIWKCYSNEAYTMLLENDEQDVSMEISVNDYKESNDGYIDILDYEYLGVTVIGCEPAMQNAKIQMSFSANDKKDYCQAVKDLNQLLAEFNCKGGENVENEKQEFFEEVQVEENQEFEQQEEQEENVENQQFEEETKDEDVCDECGKKPCECKNDEEEDFAKENEEPQKNEEKEEKKYSQEDLDNAIANTRAEYSQLLEELETLREFKAEYDRQVKVQKLNDEMDSIVANFNVEDELVKELKEKVINGEYSMEKFELELFRNNTPIKKEFSKKESNKLPVIDNEVKMTDADHFFASYGVYKK